MVLPAEPVLASQIWASWLQRDEHIHSNPALYTGCGSFDDALLASLDCEDYALCGISGDDTVVADVRIRARSCSRSHPCTRLPYSLSSQTQVSHALIISYLLHYEDTTVTIIDARGSLDLIKLFTNIKSRLVKRARPQPSDDPDNLHHVATGLLDRIEIMRVFDYEGAIEALHEVRSKLDGPKEDSAQVLSVPVLPRSTVPDSQADIEDEVLASVSIRRSDTGTDRSKEPMKPRKLLVIDNLPSLITPVHRKDYTRGQALLANLLRSLRHLHTLHNTTTILQNTIVGLSRYRSASRPNDPTTEASVARPPPTEDTEPSPSIFASTKVKPALGPLLSESLDLHLMLHPVPKSPQDARIQIANEASRTSYRYENGRTDTAGRAGKVTFANVVEVLFDRRGARTGRFGAFDVGADGVLLDAFR